MRAYRDAFLSLNTDTCSWTASTVYRSLPTETNTEQEKRNNMALAYGLDHIYIITITQVQHFFPIPAVDFCFSFFSLTFFLFFFCIVMLRFSYIRGRRGSNIHRKSKKNKKKRKNRERQYRKTLWVKDIHPLNLLGYTFLSGRHLPAQSHTNHAISYIVPGCSVKLGTRTQHASPMAVGNPSTPMPDPCTSVLFSSFG